MGRLTECDSQGNWCVKGLPWKDTYVGRTITDNTSEKTYSALCKLKDYEDTGLMPEEIIDGKMLTGWIPVAERLPEIGEPVLITVWDKDVTIGTWYGNRWGTALRYNEDVLAWMPKPEPYRPQELEEAGQDAAVPVLQSAT